MIYLGGKNRLGPKIAAELRALRLPGQKYVEPFIGGCGVFCHMDGDRWGSDLDLDIVTMWLAAIDGWVPPSSVTEEEYANARNGPVTALRGFIKYACSWGGKPWGGFARGNREYARLASVGVVRKAKQMRGSLLYQADYRTLDPVDCLIYCDPPYAGTTGYAKAFDSDEFWSTMTRWSGSNTVVVSEYAGPTAFRLLREFPLRNKLNDTPGAGEKLFVSNRTEYLKSKVV